MPNQKTKPMESRFLNYDKPFATVDKEPKMKTKYKYIEFEYHPIPKIWLITNHKFNQHIGQLNYVKNWKQWELVPYEDTGWTMDCLADVIDFVKQLK